MILYAHWHWHVMLRQCLVIQEACLNAQSLLIPQLGDMKRIQCPGHVGVTNHLVHIIVGYAIVVFRGWIIIVHG